MKSGVTNTKCLFRPIAGIGLVGILISFPSEAMNVPDEEFPNGGFTIFDLPTRDDAVRWATKIAMACRCSQEAREFGYDPTS
jgi:hypothetical protein